MIPDSKVEAALAFLDDVVELERVVREARLAESLLKHVEAVEMKKHAELPVSAQQREARASFAYKRQAEDDAVKYAKLIALKGRREAAAYVLDVWRSQNANARTSTRVG